MTNRFYSLFLVLSLVVLALVVSGCPAPEDKSDTGFYGTAYYSVNGEIRRIDLSKGYISAVGQGISPSVMSSGRVVAVLEGIGLVEYLHGGSERRTIVAQDNASADEPYDDVFIDPQISPNGQSIAYQGVGGSIFIVETNGALVKAIGDHTRPLKRPQWLSTGELIVQGTDGLYRVSTHYELGARIVESSQIKQHVVSPDGTKVAAVIDGDVWTMNIDGTQSIRMMEGNEDVHYPAWSSNSKHIIVKDGCDLRLFPIDGGMVSSVRSRFFSFDEEQCPDPHQLDWQ